MDNIVISNENNILHLCNQDDIIDYTLYDEKGHHLDGGVLESSKKKNDINFAVKEIINIIKDRFPFSLPYTYLSGNRASNLLELIELEDYKNFQQKVNNKVVLSKKIEDTELNIEK